MVKLERSLLDRAINVAVFNKRQINRPIRYNIRTKGKVGWIEVLFNPRNQFETIVGSFMKFVHPYLAFITYKFHVEKSREIGIRIEDFYMNKFHKEPYFMNHVYAQYFHPSTLQERVRDVAFYRKPRTLFKGFKVPDWATSEKRNGWQVDAYSRDAWDNAMHEFHAEATPMQFVGERTEANALQWFRLEQFGKGTSSRLFFNEQPQINWLRHNGHVDDMDEELYSFSNANQTPNIVFGIDTTTAEGREQYKAEWAALNEMAPEIVRKEDFLFPHEMGAQISTEPYFQRLWKYYREHSLKQQIQGAVDSGSCSSSDAATALKLLGAKHHLSVSAFVLAKKGLRPDVAASEEFAATDRVMEAIGMNEIALDQNTAEDYESQFWSNFDGVFNLTEISMREEIPAFISDSSNRMKVEAIMDGRATEETQQLAAE